MNNQPTAAPHLLPDHSDVETANFVLSNFTIDPSLFYYIRSIISSMGDCFILLAALDINELSLGLLKLIHR